MVQLKPTQISILEAHWNSYTYSAASGASFTNLPGGFQAATISQVPNGLASASPARGIITSAPNNLVRLNYADSNGSIISSGGNQIYGRLTYSAGTYIITYYQFSSGVESPATLPGAGSYNIKALFAEVLYLHEVPANSNLILGFNLDTADSSTSSTLNAPSGGSINLQEASNNRISFDFAGSGIAVKFDTSSIGISIGQDIHPFTAGNDFEIFAQDGQPGFAGGNLYLRAGAAGLSNLNKPGNIIIDLYEISSFENKSSSILLRDELDDAFDISLKYSQSLEKYIDFKSFKISDGRPDNVGLRLDSGKELIFNANNGTDGYVAFNLSNSSSEGFKVNVGNSNKLLINSNDIIIGDGYTETRVQDIYFSNESISLIFTAGANLVAGDAVAIINDGGIPKIVKADANGPNYLVLGICLENISSGSSGKVCVSGKAFIPNSNWDSLPAVSDVGTDVYLSTTAGRLTITSPSGSGEYSLKIGILVSGGTNNCNILLQIGNAVLN
jgi:hypothetical protein